jgi:hypothetical protein
LANCFFIKNTHTSSRVFGFCFHTPLKYIHWRGSSKLIILIKWRLSYVGCSIFSQKCWLQVPTWEVPLCV